MCRPTCRLHSLTSTIKLVGLLQNIPTILTDKFRMIVHRYDNVFFSRIEGRCQSKQLQLTFVHALINIGLPNKHETFTQCDNLAYRL